MEPREAGADREEVIRVSRVLSSNQLAVLSTEVEGGVNDGVEGPKEDVEEAVPVDRGGDVPLTSACDSLEAWSFPSVVRTEAPSTFGPQDGSGVWRADDCVATIIKVNEVVSQEGRDAHSPPRHAEDWFGDTVEGFCDVPRGSV